MQNTEPLNTDPFGNFTDHDFKDYADGVCSSYERAYAIRNNMFDPHHHGNPHNIFGDGTTTTDHNYGNDFRHFEQMHCQILETQLGDVLVNLFEYDNYPDTLNPQQLEIMLRTFAGGGVCVGQHPTTGEIMILGNANSYGYNFYGDLLATNFTDDYLNNGKIITYRNIDQILAEAAQKPPLPNGQPDLRGKFVVFNNKNSYFDFFSTDFHVLKHYCQYLASIKAAERLNMLQLKTPYLLKTNKNGIVGRELTKKLFSGDMVIEVDQASDYDSRIETLPLAVPDRTATYQQLYRDTLNEVLTYFGIYGNQNERLSGVSDMETASRNSWTTTNGDTYYGARRQGVELLNKAFNLDIQVRWNTASVMRMASLMGRDFMQNMQMIQAGLDMFGHSQGQNRTAMKS